MAKVGVEKVLFTKRFMAFLIDILLISFISSLLTSPFVDTKKNDKLLNELDVVMENYKDGKIKEEEFIISYGDIIYSVSRNNGIISFVELIIYVLYFVVYQLYKGGQTIGKKLMNIKVVSEQGDLSMNQMIFRSFLANSLIFSILLFMFIIICNKSNYLYFAGTVMIIQYGVLFVSSLFVMFRRDGKAIHDILMKTKVINV